jgi:predicted secreted protein
MSLISTIIVFTLFWWLTFFSLLPLGLRKENNPPKGHDRGAPSTHGLGIKLFITTVVAFILSALVYWIAENNWISLWT